MSSTSNSNSNTSSPLFRGEVLTHRQLQWLGAVRLAQPMQHQLVGAISVLMIAAIIAFLCFGDYTKKAFVAGVVIPSTGALRLTAPASGVVQDLRVVEGQSVAAGTVLFTISTERISSEGDTQATIAKQLALRQDLIKRDEQAAQQRYQERVRSADARIAALNLEIVQLANEQTLLTRRVELAQANLTRHQDLANNGFISIAQVQQKQDEQLAAQSASEASKRQALMLSRERLSLQASLEEAKLSLKDELASSARNHALLGQEAAENDARRVSQVRANIAGVVTGLNTHNGQTVTAGSLLATLLPEQAQLQANFFAPTRAIGFVEPGQTVRLRYPAYPYQKFGQYEGVITEVSRSPIALSELPTAVVSALASASVPTANEQLYRIEVKLAQSNVNAYGKPMPIKAGMSVEGDIVQDTRRIVEWVFEPLYAMKGRV